MTKNTQNRQKTISEEDQEKVLLDQLTVAHFYLVSARKTAALTKHKSYENIGHSIDYVENAISFLPPKKPLTKK